MFRRLLVCRLTSLHIQKSWCNCRFRPEGIQSLPQSLNTKLIEQQVIGKLHKKRFCRQPKPFCTLCHLTADLGDKHFHVRRANMPNPVRLSLRNTNQKFCRHHGSAIEYVDRWAQRWSAQRGNHHTQPGLHRDTLVNIHLYYGYKHTLLRAWPRHSSVHADAPVFPANATAQTTDANQPENYQGP